MNEQVLSHENARFAGTKGISAANRGAGFHPAFMDTENRKVYRSCFADGTPAPLHLLDGLPDEVIQSRHAGGRVASVKLSIVSGFVRNGHFYSREEAAERVPC